MVLRNSLLPCKVGNTDEKRQFWDLARVYFPLTGGARITSETYMLCPASPNGPIGRTTINVAIDRSPGERRSPLIGNSFLRVERRRPLQLQRKPGTNGSA